MAMDSPDPRFACHCRICGLRDPAGSTCGGNADGNSDGHENAAYSDESADAGDCADCDGNGDCRPSYGHSRAVYATTDSYRDAYADIYTRAGFFTRRASRDGR